MSTYYVKNGGSDAASGLSDALAWETIAKVNGSSFNAGDSILFKRDSTWATQLVPPSSGSTGLPITFGAYNTGVDPILSGASVSDWQPVVNISGKDYITIDHFKFSDMTSNVYTDVTVAGSTYITVQNCSMAKVSVGHQVLITGNSSYVYVQDNVSSTTLYSGVRLAGNGTIRYVYVDRNDFTGTDSTKTTGQSCVEIGSENTQDIQYVWIRDNVIHSAGTVGIGLDGQASATTLQHVYIQGNIITNCGIDAGVGENIAVAGTDVEVSGNTLIAGTGTAVSGVLLYLNHTGVQTHKVFNNTISGFTGSRFGIWVQGVTAASYSDILIHHNYLSGNNVGVFLYPAAAPATVTAAIYYNVMNGNTAGVQASETTGGVLYGNTTYNSSWGIKLDANATDWTTKNNVISLASSYLVQVNAAAESGFIADSNLYYQSSVAEGEKTLNGGLEAWTGANCDNWDILGTAPSTVAKESTQIHGGTYSVAMYYEGTNCNFSQNLTLTPLKNYTFTFWEKGTSGKAYDWFLVDTVNSKYWNESTKLWGGYCENSATINGSWTQHSTTFTTLAGSSSFTLYMLNRTNPSTIYYDDISLVDNDAGGKWGWGTTDYTTLATWRTATSQEANSINSNPLFTNAAGGDFTLAVGSPCIDAGVDLGTDYQMALAPGSTWP